MTSALVDLQDISMTYTGPRQAKALHGVDLAVQAGDQVGLMGGSGSGKSTLLQVIAGLLKPQSGRVHRPQGRPHVPSLLTQFPERQFFSETVREEVAYGLSQCGVAEEEVTRRVESALEQVGLPLAEFGERSPFRLSDGEQRRVALAAALAQQRGLLLLDEPTLGLDHASIDRLSQCMDSLAAKGTAYWVASHDADFIARHCTRLVVLDAGHVVFEGPCEEFWEESVLAERYGVFEPHGRRIAARLRAAGVERLPFHSGVAEFVASLTALGAGSKEP